MGREVVFCGNFFEDDGSDGINEHSVVRRLPLRQLESCCSYKSAVKIIVESYKRDVFNEGGYFSLSDEVREIYKKGISLVREVSMLEGKEYFDNKGFFLEDSLGARVEALGGNFPLGLLLKYFTIFTSDYVNLRSGASHSPGDSIGVVVDYEYRMMASIPDNRKV